MNKDIVRYARSFVGTPYIWGGCSSQGFDCSGFMQEVLSYAGIDPVGDQSAQGLYNYFLIHGLSTTAGAGCLTFYGLNTRSIKHVAMMTSPYSIIEAGGGAPDCLTIDVAAKRGAFVRERPINARNDLLAFIMPNYAERFLKDL